MNDEQHAEPGGEMPPLDLNRETRRFLAKAERSRKPISRKQCAFGARRPGRTKRSPTAGKRELS